MLVPAPVRVENRTEHSLALLGYSLAWAIIGPSTFCSIASVCCCAATC